MLAGYGASTPGALPLAQTLFCTALCCRNGCCMIVPVSLCGVTGEQCSCKTSVQNHRVAQGTRHAGLGACWLLFKRPSVPWAPHALLGRDRSALVRHNWAWWRRPCCTLGPACTRPPPAACAVGRSSMGCRRQQCCGWLGIMSAPAAGTVTMAAAAAATQAKLRKAPSRAPAPASCRSTALTAWCATRPTARCAT